MNILNLSPIIVEAIYQMRISLNLYQASTYSSILDPMERVCVVTYLFEEQNPLIVKLLFGKGHRVKPVLRFSLYDQREEEWISKDEEDVLFALKFVVVFGL